MISVVNLKSGTIFKEDGRLYKVLDYKHQKIARGGANIVLKVRDFLSGATVRKSYSSGKKVDSVRLDSIDAGYLYRRDNEYYFMDNSTYEQFEVGGGILGDLAGYLKDGLVVNMRVFEGKVIDVELPVKVKYTVISAPPDIRGNTAQGGNKNVELENGLNVSVPMFIKKGDTILVDTRDGRYVERS